MNFYLARIAGFSWSEFPRIDGQAKAKGKTVRKDFKAVTLEYKGKIADVVLAHRASNSEIREAVHNFLAGFERGVYSWTSAKRFYVDKAFLFRQIDFLDIRSLIDRVEEDRDHG